MGLIGRGTPTHFAFPFALVHTNMCERWKADQTTGTPSQLQLLLIPKNASRSFSRFATETNKGLFHHKLISACTASPLPVNSGAFKADQTPLE